ncbi:MAG: flagellar FlbD family protein [Chloroflexi bacterium]|nr:flagellar FlbD family protein [Chloroflexota bacterium]
MIKVSRLDGTGLVVNAELIELIEATPDTVLSLTSGTKLIVREPLDEVVALVISYRQRTRPDLVPAAPPRPLAR